MTIINTSKVIERLQEIFMQWGIPNQIVSGNEPQFISAKFKQFCDRFEIRHIRTTPYHPKTNELAERFVRIFKQICAAIKNDAGNHSFCGATEIHRTRRLKSHQQNYL